MCEVFLLTVTWDVFSTVMALGRFSLSSCFCFLGAGWTWTRGRSRTREGAEARIPLKHSLTLRSSGPKRSSSCSPTWNGAWRGSRPNSTTVNRERERRAGWRNPGVVNVSLERGRWPNQDSLSKSAFSICLLNLLNRDYFWQRFMETLPQTKLKNACVEDGLRSRTTEPPLHYTHYTFKAALKCPKRIQNVSAPRSPMGRVPIPHQLIILHGPQWALLHDEQL